MERTIIKSRNFNAYFGTNHVVKNVNIDIPKNNVVAVMTFGLWKNHLSALHQPDARTDSGSYLQRGNDSEQ